MAERHSGPVVLVAPGHAKRAASERRDQAVYRQHGDGAGGLGNAPYDSFSPHQDIISSRLATLYQLPTMQRGVLIVPVSTLMSASVRTASFTATRW